MFLFRLLQVFEMMLCVIQTLPFCYPSASNCRVVSFSFPILKTVMVLLNRNWCPQLFPFLPLQAQHAAEIGVDGIAVIAPSFFKQVNKGE